MSACMVRQLRVYYSPYPKVELMKLKNDDTLWFLVRLGWILTTVHALISATLVHTSTCLHPRSFAACIWPAARDQNMPG